ncbi:SRPBCC family protein [Leifsonia sp. LS-T14]|uniref:SRPBCC family protein n=1 Tax=unclassified Leifsonia TaxID=2663824 RepID=UPI0035A6552B
MDADTLRALIGTSDRPEIVLRREYRATEAEVREACTSLPRLARWFGAVEGAPTAVGDAFVVRLGADGSAGGSILRCDRNSVEVSWTAGPEPASILSAEWRATRPERTELVLRHRLGAPGEIASTGAGWEQVLADLASAFADPLSRLPRGKAGERSVVWRTLAARPLELTQEVDAGRARVWAAIASAEGLRTWWWRHWDDVTIEADVRVGGGYRIAAPRAGIVLEGRYLAVEAPDRLAFSWRWVDGDGASVDEAVEIVLTGDAARTRLTVRHTGPWADDAPAESYRQGWTFTLGELAAVLASPVGAQ